MGPDKKTKHYHRKPSRPYRNPGTRLRGTALEAMRDKKRAIAKHLASQDGEQAYTNNAQPDMEGGT